MKSATISWVLPLVRDDGEALDPADIDFVDVGMSADLGQTFGDLTQVLPTDPQNVFVPDLEIGDWHFRFVVQDSKGDRSMEVFYVVSVPDERAAPGIVTDVTHVFS